MSTIKATVKDRRLELEVPADWPDGTEVEIHPVGSEKSEEKPFDEEWSNSPEAIAAWLKWYDSLEPLILTPEEEADAEAWLRKANDYSLARLDKSVEDLFK